MASIIMVAPSSDIGDPPGEVEARDRWTDWSLEQQLSRLHPVASHARYVLPGWHRPRNPSSRVHAPGPAGMRSSIYGESMYFRLFDHFRTNPLHPHGQICSLPVQVPTLFEHESGLTARLVKPLFCQE